MPNPRIVLTTTGNPEQARQLARELVEHHMAACVTAFPGVLSTYWWSGKIEEDHEVLLMIKTTDERLEELKSHVLRVHPYEVPEFLVLDLEDGGDLYMRWLIDNTTRLGQPAEWEGRNPD